MLLLDNDAATKLARYDLLAELLIAFRVGWADIYLLDSLKYRFHLTDALHAERLLGSSGAVQRVQQLVAQTQPLILSTATVTETMNLLNAIDDPGIDAGEQVLFAYLAADPDSTLITGDKNAIRALARHTYHPAIASCQGRIICLEQAVKTIALRGTVAALCSKLQADSAADKAVAICARQPSSFLDCMDSYIAALRASAGGLLCPDI
ncbi:hypothetical protein HPT27_12180 [Permianibacter sp. IMCC34836]|uniref:hypothetical protein n=1 Tax=Permianibacter fluminis TaxID=2738515 RepID=UPI0015554871|nr:hypothetical protein [Permianibacter fluminis]NQD37785.1 hypothetical protein [Permianibacter fluminis]